MKSIIFFVLFVVFSLNAQKVDNVYFNKLENVSNTNYVVCASQKYSKLGDENNSKLLLIDTETSLTKEINFSKSARISKVSATITCKYQNADFILVEVSQDAQKSLPKANDIIRELHLVELNTFNVIKLSTTHFSLVEWVINEKTETLVFIERENGIRNNQAPVQKIVTMNLKTGDAKEIYKIN